jgi:hypothetical protein
MLMATAGQDSRSLGDLDDPSIDNSGVEVATRRVKRNVFIDTMMTIYGLKKTERHRRELLFRLYLVLHNLFNL